MIHFMVDWENIQHNGLRGSRYLYASDQVTIFYSKCCNRIEQGDLEEILHSGCKLDLCKLVNTGKDALDHYISSKIGTVFGSGYTGDVAIVSKDKGFQAVLDYWKYCVKPGRKIVLSPNIETCIVNLDEKSERRKQIQRNLQVLDLEKEYEKYKDEQRIYDELRILFANTEYQNYVNQIMHIISKQKTQSKVVYLNTLKQFGKKDGLEIYRKLKQWTPDEVV